MGRKSSNAFCLPFSTEKRGDRGVGNVTGQLSIESIIAPQEQIYSLKGRSHPERVSLPRETNRKSRKFRNIAGPKNMQKSHLPFIYMQTKKSKILIFFII